MYQVSRQKSARRENRCRDGRHWLAPDSHIQQRGFHPLPGFGSGASPNCLIEALGSSPELLQSTRRSGLLLGTPPARIPTIPILPSWQAYSKIGSAECMNGIVRLHGFVHVPGSSIVISYFRFSGPAPGETLNHMKLFARDAFIKLSWLVIRRIHHERIAFPMPA